MTQIVTIQPECKLIQHADPTKFFGVKDRGDNRYFITTNGSPSRSELRYQVRTVPEFTLGGKLWCVSFEIFE